MKAHYLIAIAENDDKQQPDAKDVLRDSFAKAKLPAKIEVYAGTLGLESHDGVVHEFTRLNFLDAAQQPI
jgi:hypothetical protein